MGEEATPVVVSEQAKVEVPDESIGEIVDSLDWPDGGATDPAPPATGKSATAETVEGKKDEPKTDPSPAPKPALLSDEELGKLTIKEISNPSFDWSTVSPTQAALLKRWQADVTRRDQALAEIKRAKADPKSTPQPVEEPEEDPTDKTNREIVAKALKDLGLNPEIVQEAVGDLVTSKGVAIAAQSVPQYFQDEKLHAAVNDTIAKDEYLAAQADSQDPTLIARAIQDGVLRVEHRQLTDEVTTLRKREADLTAREKALTEKETAVEAERTKLNRQRPSIAAGSQQGAPSKPTGEPKVKEIVDDIWPAQGIRLG